MGRVLETGKHPELLTGQNAVDIVGNEVVYLIVCHCTNYDVIAVRFSMAAVDDKIEPFLRHFPEFENVQAGLHAHRIGAHYTAVESLRPALSLLSDDCAVKAKAKIFCVSAANNPRTFDGNFAAVIYCHFSHDNLSLRSFGFIYPVLDNCKFLLAMK